MQRIKGGFEVTFRGFPLIFFSRTELTSEKGSRVAIYSMHITPLFAFGFVRKL